MFFDLPQGAKVDKYLAGMPTTQWLTWTNPRNEYSNAIILTAGGGGGGGSGIFGAAGGGGGGFGHIYCPLSLLPDILYIQVGIGGLSASGNGLSGANGTASLISMYPSSATANNLITCNGGSGGSGTASTVPSGGSVTINNTLGIAQGFSGGDGGVRQTGGTGIYSLPTTGSPIYGGGGAGGGGGAALGGGMTSVSSLYPSTAGGYVNGFVIWKPFTVFGGSGSDAISNKSGNGIMGSGGGGRSSSSAPVGYGKGGDGFVIIICY